MVKLIVIIPGDVSERLDEIIKFSLNGYDYDLIKTVDQIETLKNRKILFIVELKDTGINIELYKILENIKLSGDNFMEGSVGSVIINSQNELSTRAVARQIIFSCNMAGCMFPGRPLSEATGSLCNFNTYQKITDKNLIDICKEDCLRTVEQLIDFKVAKIKKPKILTLHASNYKTSNTLMLWNIVKENLKEFEINEIHIENGSVRDCKGCMYKACKHYSEGTNCFYGGVMVDEVYPAILDCDVIVFLCPNYNDSISSNISAVINRLTALFRKTKFYDKYMYAVIVSGHSGSDLLAHQLISGLNINKTFMLPPKFAMMETANDIGAIAKIENIEQKAKDFAGNIKKMLKT